MYWYQYMTTPIFKPTLIGVGAIMLLALIALPLYPLLVLSFESGVVVGLILHSSHTKSAHENGWVEYSDEHKL